MLGEWDRMNKWSMEHHRTICDAVWSYLEFYKWYQVMRDRNNQQTPDAMRTNKTQGKKSLALPGHRGIFKEPLYREERSFKALARYTLYSLCIERKSSPPTDRKNGRMTQEVKANISVQSVGTDQTWQKGYLMCCNETNGNRWNQLPVPCHHISSSSSSSWTSSPNVECPY